MTGGNGVGARRIWLDLEATGTDPDADRIVEIALLDTPSGERIETLVNPGVPIPPEATEVHGITAQDVVEAPTFADVAPEVQRLIGEMPSDTGPPAICTYNGRRYDVPLLDAELRRAGFAGFERDKVGRIIANDLDLYRIWVDRERRDLTAAAKRFAGVDLDGHRAGRDMGVLPSILAGMAQEFGFDPTDTASLVKASVPEGEVDRAGRFRKDGKRVVFNFGKHRDEDVRNHLDYILWMLERDFPEETLAVATWLLKHYG